MKIPDEPHGVLAHYFAPPAAQGALTMDEWERGLDAYGDRLVTPSVWLARWRAGTLVDECVVTLDDGLAEQLPALTLLERRGLTAFVNVYTQPLVGVPHSLEAHRAARNRHGVDDFYARWREIMRGFGLLSAPKAYLADRGYLTQDDRDFRFWRNEMADEQEYEEIMRGLGSEPLPLSHWLRAAVLSDLHDRGHVIGLHSHTHPTVMAGLTREQQAMEWATSKYVLESILGEPVTTASWPCGQATDHGKEWMQAHGIALAWGATMAGEWPYEVPRLSTGYWR